MTAELETAAAETKYEGEVYNFCAPGFKVAFESDPEEYLEDTGIQRLLSAGLWSGAARQSDG